MLFGITKEWLVTKKACNMLLWSAFAAILLTSLFVFFNIVDEDSRVNIADRVNDSFVLSSIVGILVTPVIIATGLLYVAMWVYWATVDTSSPDTKTVWFFLMILGMWLAASVYYFVIYRRQVLKHLSHPENMAKL